MGIWTRAVSRRTAARLALLGATGSVAACSPAEEPAIDPAGGLRPSGRVEFETVQAAYIEGGGGGRGTLHFRGRTHRFTVVRGGIGGVGASAMTAEGTVYNLRDLNDFPGPYVQARSGVTLGTGSGELWLENPRGVVMHLRARREGLMLSLGADAVMISFE